MSLTLAARWLFTAAGPPLPGGCVVVDGAAVAAVAPAGVYRPDLDLGDMAILPGLVNAHTHLDLSFARGQTPPVPGEPFPDWLARVVALRRSRPPGETADAVRAGLNELLTAGTTLVGDISADGTSAAILAEAPIRSVVFRELLGLPDSRAAGTLAAADAWLAANPGHGFSPHAPYSVGRSLIEGASARGVGVQIHLAESPDERELLANHGGPFVPFLERLGVWEPASLAPDFAWVVAATAAAPFAVLAHANYLPPANRLGPNQSVAYCPRTHAAFGHAPHPYAAMLAAGNRVCLGTDSLASNPDLDILAEARHLWAKGEVDGPTLLAMLTQYGAEALGLGGVTGTLEAGKAADLAAVPIDAAERDPWRALFGGRGAGGRRAMAGGVWRAADVGRQPAGAYTELP